MGEIQAIIRQITASVTFLPMLEDKCTFDLLVYTKADSEVPQQWCVPPSRTRWGVEVPPASSSLQRRQPLTVPPHPDMGSLKLVRTAHQPALRGCVSAVMPSGGLWGGRQGGE
jgi:hypothetical protein